MTFPHLDKLIKEQEKGWSRGRSQESHLLSHIKIDQMKSSAPWSSAMEIFDICGIRSSLHFINLPPFSLALSFGSSCESEACRNSRWASKERGFGFWSGAVAGFSPCRRGFRTQESFITVDQALYGCWNFLWNTWVAFEVPDDLLCVWITLFTAGKPVLSSISFHVGQAGYGN